MSTFEFFSWFIVGIVVYRMVSSYMQLKEIEKNVEYATELLEEHAKLVIVVFERVKHDGEEVILCYDTDNNFISQGATKDEVVEKAQDRFPSKKIATYKKEELQWITPEKVNKNTTVD